ncbi:MAG: CCA tRNA nucleotidyltransferase [Planctomycetota bacterium]
MSRDAALQIIRRLREHGHVAYLAGGCVRDRLLGLNPKDHDVATDATPHAVQRLFRRSQPVGEAFGVVLVYPPWNAGARSQADGKTYGNGGIEVATFRTEGVYSDGRRPDDVRFSDARHDAQRRDFTINGLFEDPFHPEPRNPHADRDGVIDYVGGRADLETRVVRAIGDPGRRFAEDYLRMLRAVRFSARLNFTLDPATAAAIKQHAPRLDRIARERIGGEVAVMLRDAGRVHAVAMLEDLGLDEPVLNETHAASRGTALRKLPADVAYPTALAAWLFDRRGDFPRPADVARWRGALCLTNDDPDTLGRILRHVRAAEGWATMGVAARKRLLAARDWDAALCVLRALDRAQVIKADTPALRDDGVGLAPAPLIDGGDLIRLGLKPGPTFKTLLDDVYDAQLEGRLATPEQATAWIKTHAEF